MRTRHPVYGRCQCSVGRGADLASFGYVDHVQLTCVCVVCVRGRVLIVKCRIDSGCVCSDAVIPDHVAVVSLDASFQVLQSIPTFHGAIVANHWFHCVLVKERKGVSWKIYCSIS